MKLIDKHGILIVLVLMFSSISVYATSTIIGVGTHLQEYDGESEIYLKKIQDMGFSSFRDDYSWSKIEKTKGVFAVSENIKKTDNAFLNAKKYGLDPILVLDYGNKFYNDGDYPRDKESIDAFVKYATWTVSKFKGKVTYYEIWNEWPAGTGMKQHRDAIPSADVYFNLVKETSKAIRGIDPHAVILAGSGGSPFVDVMWFEQLLNLGVLNYVDGISVHTYSWARRSLRTVEGNLDYLDKFYSVSKRVAGKDFPIYITEIGVTNYTGPGGMSQKESADYITNYIQSAKSRSYIKGVWIYDFINDGTDKSNSEDNFGLLNHDLSPKLVAPRVSKILNKK